MTRSNFKIVSLATLFNLSFEYAVGGVDRIFDKPMTIVFLTLIYFSLFAMLEDLIQRFKLNNLQIAVFAIGFGIFPELYLTGSIFGAPLILGINWQAFLTINIVWWGGVAVAGDPVLREPTCTQAMGATTTWAGSAGECASPT